MRGGAGDVCPGPGGPVIVLLGLAGVAGLALWRPRPARGR